METRAGARRKVEMRNQKETAEALFSAYSLDCELSLHTHELVPDYRCTPLQPAEIVISTAVLFSPHSTGGQSWLSKLLGRAPAAIR